MKPTEYYISEKDSTSQKLTIIKKKLLHNTTFRLISFLCIVGFLFGLVQFNMTVAISLSLFSLIVFGTLVKRHINYQKKRDYSQARLTIIENELDACNHIFSSFKDGEKYRNSNHRFSHDLDLFGKGSLFQMINRTVTQSGEKNLADHIQADNTSIDVITKIQEAVKELSSIPELVLHFRASGSVSETAIEDMPNLVKWKDTPSYINKHNYLNITRYLLPCLTVGSLAWLIVAGSGVSVFTILFVLNLVFTGFFFKSTGYEHNKVSAFNKKLTNYQMLLEIIEKHDFESHYLKQVSKEIKDKKTNASVALRELTKSLNAFDTRLNLIAAILLEGLLLWDFHCLFKVENWRKKYGEHLIPWLESVAQFDALFSMATFTFNNPDFIFPTPKKDKVIETKNTGHPFIPGSVRITNDFSIINKGNFVIITGANMAGKSTFLRTIGINLVLAMSGMPVCSTEFRFTPRKLFTSMRTSDSLNENESYFYAELKRLKQLIDMLSDGQDLFIMLDEILKGTNSVDKQKGSQLALEKILQLKGSGIIATHDLALTDMEKSYPENIKNQCFEIEIDKTKIKFDYKLHPGVTKNMNAMLLMEQMGIIK